MCIFRLFGLGLCPVVPGTACTANSYRSVSRTKYFEPSLFSRIDFGLVCRPVRILNRCSDRSSDAVGRHWGRRSGFWTYRHERVPVLSVLCRLAGACEPGPDPELNSTRRQADDGSPVEPALALLRWPAFRLAAETGRQLRLEPGQASGSSVSSQVRCHAGRVEAPQSPQTDR